MKLTITEEIIAGSKRMSASNCILANAGRHAGLTDCMCNGVDLLWVDFKTKRRFYQQKLTPEAKALVQAWDNGQTISPCTLILPDVEA